MRCSRCQVTEVPAPRVELGATTCLRCAEVLACEEIARKAKDVALNYPKGAYQYMPSTKVSDTLDSRRSVFAAIVLTDNVPRRVNAVQLKARRKPIGVFWKTAEERASSGGTLFYDKDDGRLKDAHRVVFYAER